MSGPAKNPTGSVRQVALVLGIVGAVSIAGAAAGVSAIVRMSKDAAADRDAVMREQALQCARTGLTEAINWMRRQAVQPVVRFAPTRLDSIAPEIGMVREFPIAERLWGRFEVWREAALDEEAPDVAATRRRLGVEDLSMAEGHPAPGVVWRMRCAGFVFEREHADQPFRRDSAAVLYSEVLEVDVARIGLRLPGQAALCARDRGAVVVGRDARVDGGAHAVAIYCGTAVGRANLVAEVTAGSVRGVRGVVSATSAEFYDDSVSSVFGVDRATLFAMADACITDVTHFPDRLSANSLYCVDVPVLACTPERPLRGSGILFVEGDLSIEAGSAVQFAGLVYVDGALSIHAKASITGAVVVTGKVSIQGGREAAKLVYDDGVLRRLRDAVGSYRMVTPITRSGGSDR